MAQFSLSWDAHKQSICTGLCSLQQNGEFVDMTIAADGHHVKVHQMVMSLVSPYIKDLITSAQCPHPVIFLNKVSYPTLCSMLEYIYTGEVMVDKEKMAELVQAGKELHIRGLEDMKIEIANENRSQLAFAISNEGQPLSERGYSKNSSVRQPPIEQNKDEDSMVTRQRNHSPKRELFYDSYVNDSTFDDAMDTDHETDTNVKIKAQIKDDKKKDTTIQYTTSNRGAIQIIVNRYMYNLTYTSKSGDARRWECVDARNSKCKATLYTKGSVIVKRCSAHNHSFHDRRILKKVQENLVYSALNDMKGALKTKNQGKQENKPSKSPSKNKKTDKNNSEDTTDAE